MKKITWENYLKITLAILVFAIPWVFSDRTLSTGLIWNFWIVSLLVVQSAGFDLADSLRPSHEWVSFAAGVWLFLSPWLLNFGDATAWMWSSMVLGLAIAVLSAVIGVPAAKKSVQRRRMVRP